MFLIRLCFFVWLSLLNLSMADDTIESAAIREEIDALEKQKVLLQQTIKYAEEQLPIARETRKDVESYGKKMQEVITNNNYKTMMSGGINIVLEVTGAGNKGKLVDLAAWLIGKGIGLGMENSKTFAGQAYYKNKIEGVSATQKNLTGELDKLYKISHSSDEAMKSYYNKYGKYSDSLEIGEVGIFTQRMRLITEQSAVSLASLDALIDSLHRTLTDSELDLRNTERRIEMLRKKLDELADKSKEENDKEQKKAKERELSDAEKNAATLQPSSKTSVSLPGEPQGCRVTYKSQELTNTIISIVNGIVSTAEKSQNTLNTLVSDRAQEQQAYLLSLNKEKDAIEKTFFDEAKYFQYSLEGQALEKIMQGNYPTGAPFQVFIEHTNNAHKDYVDRLSRKIASLKSLSDSIISGIPTQYDDRISQEMTNVASLKANYNQIWRTCFQSEKYLNFTTELAPSDGTVQAIKFLKKLLSDEIDKEEKNLDEMNKWHAKRMPEIEKLFKDRRAQMRDEIASYEAKMKQKIAHEESIIGLIQQLQGAYSSSGVSPKVSNGEKSYHFSLDGTLESTLCKTLGKIKTAASSAGLEKTSALQKKIRMMIEFSRIYGVDGVPVDAYIEYSQDPQKVELQYNAHNQAYAKALDSYTNSGSDAQFIIESIEANAFHMLASQYPNSLFYTYYREQIRVANEMKHRIKNANVEINNALEQDKIYADRPKAFMDMYELINKEFKENFGCIPLDSPVINGLAEEIEAMKERIDKVKSKPLFTDAAGTIKNARALLEKVKNLSVDVENIEAYKKTYTDYKKEYQSYIDFIKEHASVSASDKNVLNSILLEIESYFGGHDDFFKQRDSSNQQQRVEELYQRFAQEYSNKNLSSLMSLLSDEWMSSSDGTTLMDLEETLVNSFSIFNEVKCTIDSLYISSIGDNTYRVNYVVTIQGENYENDIKHLEKSSVSEEVKIIDGKPKISQTLSGKYWKTR